MRPADVARERQPGKARLLPSVADPYPQQGYGADPPNQGVPQSGVPRKVTDDLGEIVPVRGAECIIKATNERITTESTLCGCVTKLAQCLFALRVRDADRRQSAPGAPHDRTVRRSLPGVDAHWIGPDLRHIGVSPALRLRIER